MNLILEREAKREATNCSSILKTLTYFSIFKYPLLKEEIKKFLHPDDNIAEFERTLARLVEQGSVFTIDGFYYQENDPSVIARRREGNLRAEKLLPKAMKIGRFLFSFPFVRGIGISGSLSKMYADERADIDFFIVTKANRLWIARSFMHLFKKLTFLAGRQHYYCMNYYVDDTALKLEDQNIYTAVETITLIPVCGNGMNEFFIANEWVSNWFQNVELPNQKPFRKYIVKEVIEWMLDNHIGNRLDHWLQQLTTRRWKTKKRKGLLNHEGKPMDLVTGRHFAKSNPGMFQEKLLRLYDKKVKELK